MGTVFLSIIKPPGNSGLLSDQCGLSIDDITHTYPRTHSHSCVLLSWEFMASNKVKPLLMSSQIF